MPWYFPWSDSIKKRACRYLLQRYLGHFLQEKLTLEQLTVDLYNGTGRVENVPLDVWSVNEMLESVCSPLEIVDGYISSISVSVPWTALLNDSCCLDIQGLELTLAPKQKSTDTGMSMMDSMIWQSMTTSMQLAQECLKQTPSSGEEQAEASQTFEGLESFAQTIESVLSRIKLSFTDTIVRLEHLCQDNKTGIGVEIHIKRIEYCDFSTELSENNGQFKAKSVYEPAAFACKNLKIIGVTCHLEEFPEQERTANHAYSPHMSPASSTSSPPIPSPLGLDRLSTEIFAAADQLDHLLPSTKIATFAGQSEIKLKVKQNLAVPGPKVDVECFLGTLNVFLSPSQVHLLLEVASALSTQDSHQKPEMKGRSASKPMQPEDYQRIEQDLHNQLQAKRRESQHKVDLWNTNFDSYGTSDEFSHPSSGTEYDSVLGDDGEEHFYSMTAHDILPPLEEPKLPVDMVAGSALLPSHGLSGIAAGSFSSTGSLANNISLNYARLGSARVPVPGTSLTEAAGSVFVSAHQSLSPTGKTPPGSRPRALSSNNPGLAGIAALDDPSPDTIKLSLRLSSVAVTVLHVDPVLSPASSTTGSSPDEIGNDSNHPVVRMAENFFTSLGTFGFGSKDFDDMKDKFAEACRPADHLRCVCAPLSVEVEKTCTSSHQTVSSDLSVGKLELLECLFERPSTSTTHSAPCSCTKLLKFTPEDHSTLHNFTTRVSSSSPCLKAKYRNTQRTLSPGGVQSRNTIVPKSELCLELGPLFSELDVSIVDRLGGLLHPQSSGHARQGSPNHARMFRSVNPSTMNQQALFKAAIDDGPSVGIPLCVRASCPSFTVALRFPIPDLRPEVDRRPWWKQSLRDEILLFDFSSVEFNTELCGSEPPKEYDLQFKQLEGHLKRIQYGDLIPLLCVNPGQGESDSSNKGFDWPRIVISIKPAAPLSILEEVQSTENSPLSSLDAYPVMKTDPSPFSSKPVMFDTEQLVIPGSQEEMGKFQEDTTAASRVHVECTLPNVDINLHTKDVFELLYNRLASDLLLWEPAAPCPVERADMYGTSIGGLDLASQMLQAQGPDRFVMCRSGVRADDDSSSSDESEFSSFEQKQRKMAQELNGQTLLAFTLNIGKGRLALFPETKDTSPTSDQDAKEPEELGEVIAELDDFTFFLAACYRGRADLSYLCLQSRKASILHAPHAQRDSHVTLESAFCGAELQSTLYPSEAGVTQGLGDSGEPMLALAMKVSMDMDKNVKEILLSLGLRDATVRHRIMPAGQMWLNQVMEYMDVNDDPVLGFVPPAVVTVFHTHVWGGVIDYRPIHLPLRALITMETFSVSSNITIESSVSLLRFIIDDAALYLSDKCSGAANIKNHVCVMDMGMFELSLFTSDGRDKRHPKVELRMSSDTLHIRTCSDSFSALLQLIQYIAADGDLVPSYEPDEPKAGTPSTPSRCPTDSPVKQVSLQESEMSCIMSEAMADSPGADDKDLQTKDPRSDLNRQLSKSPKRDLFLFPGDEPLYSEDASFGEEDAESSEPDKEKEEEKEDGEEGESDDDEFCILEHPDKEPEGLTDQVLIKCLVHDEIKLVENHFAVPLGPSDQLRAPDHFPPAVFRYTLREMSIVWQMFGGQDLNSTSQQSNTTKKVSFADEMRKSQRTEDRASPAKRAPTRRTGAGLRKGGPGRNHDELMELHVNKIRFQHETYPEDTEQASRMVFMAQDVEIRDRLAHSQINKFLYQYTSESMPKQTHANMVLVKMLYVRPEGHLTGQECCLRVSIQPLRLNVDQDALFFLRSFFSEVAEEASKNPKGSNAVESSPVKTIAVPSFSEEQLLLDLRDAAEEPCLLTCVSEPADEEPVDAEPPSFFRSFVFSPEVPIRLDYQGKHVDMDQGTLAGLLIGLAQLNCSELRLKRLCCRSGLLGIDKVASYALAEWLNDIRRTQLPGILGGVGPVHSFVQLFQGLVDLVRLPIDQYRKDGRVMLGLQRGANAFTTSSAMAFLELANRGVHLVQAAAETAYDMVNPGLSMSPSKRGQHRLAQQPADLREGMSNAYQVVTQGLGRAANNIVQVAKDEHEQKGVTGAVGGVLRQVPATMVQPLILATEATSNVLGGVRNQILPDARREATEKWKASP